LLDDPTADETLREVLRGAPTARSLDRATRRRLGAKVARASALPAVAASWLFVKSAAAALGVVLGTGAIAVSTGVIDWSPARPVQVGPQTPKKLGRAASPTPSPPVVPPGVEPEVAATPPIVVQAPAALPSASSGGTLSAETLLLEQARREMRGAPAVALSIAAEHAQRFPRGQLASERALIQIEALHRLGRDAEAGVLARGLLGGAGSGLYAERVHQLLGKSVEP
jgi:hypothetical protein